MHRGVYFLAATGAAHLVYKKLSSCSCVSPKVTNTEVAHATLAANPLINNTVGATMGVKVETPAQVTAVSNLSSGVTFGFGNFSLAFF